MGGLARAVVAPRQGQGVVGVTRAMDKPPKVTRGGPPRVLRSPLTGTWYVVTAYRDYGHGNIEAVVKREVHPDDATGLESMFKATHDEEQK